MAIGGQLVAKISSSTVDVGNVAIRGVGVEGEAAPGLVLARGRVDRADAALRHPLFADDAPGFRVRAEVTASIRPADRLASRGPGDRVPRGEQPHLVLTGPQLADDEHGQIAMIDEGGFISFVLPTSLHPDGGVHRFEVPVDVEVADDPTRGAVQQIGKLGIRFLSIVGAKRAANAGVRSAARGIEGRLRKHRLGAFPAGPGSDGHQPLAAARLAGGSALLLIHGTNSSCRRTFRFDRQYVDRLHDRYGGRVFAFDHPSIGCSPGENAAELASLLEHAALEQVDILAHSRGGLVARELLELNPAGVQVRSVTFVGTPNGGTPLADPKHLDDFLSLVSNVVGVLPDNPVTDPIGIALEVLREWVLEPIGVLPGLAAMRTGSDDLERLARAGTGDVRCRAIAANYEPRSNDGVPARLRNVVMDRAFAGENNDLVVPTRSVYVRTGQFHIRSEDRLVLDASFGVSHNGFWRENLVLKQLDQWIDPDIRIELAEPAPSEYRDGNADLEAQMRSGGLIVRTDAVLHRLDHLDAATDVMGAPLGRSVRGKRTGPARRGVVVVLPGIMGSRLEVDGREIWFNPWHLLRGRFPLLSAKPGNPATVSATGLLPQYDELVDRLADSWSVLPFTYDWRLPIEGSAELLAAELDRRGIDLASKDRPVHFVAHSMGGLVARRLLQLRKSQWDAGAGKLVQLGTPNLGSFAMPLAVLGRELLVRALVLADLLNDEEEILDTIKSFPGVFELFPSPEQKLPDGDGSHGQLYEATTWPARDRAGVGPLLEGARGFHAELAENGTDDRYVYIAGDGHRTPYRARVEADGDVSFGISLRGDGRVPHDFGFEGLGIKTVYYSAANHGDLVKDKSVLAAIGELLATGKTDKLETAPRVVRSAEPSREIQWVRAADVESTIGFPQPARRGGSGVTPAERQAHLVEAASLYVGRTAWRRVEVPALKVRVVHGSLEQAMHPVAAGRYKGIPVGGALKYIDQRLKNALTELHDLGLFPQEAGTSRYVPAPAGTYPNGAILLGLGDFGLLTPELLAQAVRSGTLDYALAAKRGHHEPPVLGISSVLIGTPGRYGLTVVDSIAATIRGVARAASELAGRVIIDELELIELYEGAAADAASALDKLRASSELSDLDVTVHIDPEIEVRPGGRPGSRSYDESGAPWPRISIELDEAGRAFDPPHDLRTLKYVSLGRSAQAGNLEVQVNVAEIRRHVHAAMESPDHDDQTKNTLFELLFPNDAKLDIESFDNLHLLVDEETAWIPWEMFAGRGVSGELNRPLALRAGFLRQLKPTYARARRPALSSSSTSALVIGDPPSGRADYGRLAGARDEANLVADLLDRDFVVTQLVYGDDVIGSDEIAAQIRDAFFAQHHRIVHIAAHGDLFEPPPEGGDLGGVIIGPHDVLGSRHFRQKLVVPDLVFLNCCHVGRIEMSAGVQQRKASFAEVAASLALELMNSGVKAVVAAGWAVDDRAAKAFAGTFYQHMVAGHPFGESVRQARRAADDGGRSNTWGAYQCYGDPDFQLTASLPTTAPSKVILSAVQLKDAVAALGQRAGDSASAEHLARVLDELRAHEAEHLPRYDDSPELWQALADAYSEAGAFDDAVNAYRKAVLNSKNGAVSISAVQQLANLEVRLATHKHRQPPTDDAGQGGHPDVRLGRKLIKDTPARLFTEAERRLNRLQALHETAECHALLGSLYKKRATTVGGTRREQLLAKSRDAYGKACDHPAKAGGAVAGADLQVYHGCLAVLMAYVANPDGAAGEAALSEQFRTYYRRLREQQPKYSSSAGGYFERAQAADIAAVDILLNGQLGIDEARASLVAGFLAAFAVRSSVRQRLSVIDNYRDLSVLLRTDELRRAAGWVADELEAFPTPP